MSLLNLVKDVVTGNFTSAGERLKDWWENSAVPGLQRAIQVAESEEGKILQSLVPVAAKDVLSGGLTTDSFIAAAKDVGSQLLAKNITMAQTDIFAALNNEVGAQAAAQGIAVPTNAGTSQPVSQ